MFADIAQLLLLCLALTALVPLLGTYMKRVYAGEPTLLTPLLRPVEAVLYRLLTIKPDDGQHWTRYAASAVIFNAICCFTLYLILRLQHILPLNPLGYPSVPPDLAFNTAVSFITNTGWQSYSGEVTLSHFSQMAGIAVQNFTSAATGMAVAMACIRGFVMAQTKTLGNFYADLVRGVLYILLPIAFVLALVFVWQGVPQNFDSPVKAATLEGQPQGIAQGPMASQIAIKQLSTSGGGFLNANAAHPYENPTPVSNFIQMLMIVLIPAAFFYTFGLMANDTRQGWMLYAASGAVVLAAILLVYAQEIGGNPLFNALPVDQTAGNMEGKEVRLGVMTSSIWAVLTTATSSGSTNAMLDSYTPIGGMIPLLMIQLGEIFFGGCGSGLYGTLLFVLLTVFIAGLMVGRTPEYLGKKIEARELKLAMLALLPVTIGALGVSAVVGMTPFAQPSISNGGPHGLTQLLFAYSSASGNNGAAFAGFNANTPFHNIALGLCMLFGRFGFMIPMIAIAGGMALKKKSPAGSGTLPTHTPIFAALLIFVIFLLNVLSYLPALALGPVAEHFAMHAGKTY